MNEEALKEKALIQVVDDVLSGDLTAIAELMEAIPLDALLNFLSEENSK